jgi:phospholipid transport system substrate-binding protein
MIATLAALLALMLPLAATPAYAAADSPQVPASAASQVDGMLREGVGKLIEFMEQVRGGQAEQQDTLAFLDREITPYFDFAYMARWVGGSLYPRLNAAQRVQLQAKLKRLFYSTLAAKLGSYEDRTIRYFAPRPGRSGREITLTAWIVQPQAMPIKLDFRFYSSPHGWRVFDVVANRTSAVMYYRQYFNRMLRRHGPEWLQG